MNGQVFTATMAPLTGGIGIFTGILPDLKEVRRASPKDPLKHDLRVGEFTGAIIVLAIGGAASYFTKSKVPLIAAFIVIAALCFMYEYILAITPKERKA